MEDERILTETIKINKLLEKQIDLLEKLVTLFEKYDDEYLQEVEKDGIIRQE
jgi:hypothetical protein